jgi:hypothetical protein
MSAMGQKRRLRPHPAMSALTPKATRNGPATAADTSQPVDGFTGKINYPKLGII